MCVARAAARRLRGLRMLAGWNVVTGTESDWGLERLLAMVDLLLDGTRAVEELATTLSLEWVRAGEDRSPLWLPAYANVRRT